MIYEILQEVRKRGLLDHNVTPFCTNLVRHIKLFYHLPDGSGLFIKIANGEETKREFYAMETVRTILGKHVPEPLLLVENRPHTALVAPLLQHRPMALGDLKNPAIRDQVQFIIGSHLMSRHVDLPCRPVSAEKTRSLFQDQHFICNWPKWVERYTNNRMDSVCQELPLHAQHGDCTLFNFGIYNGTVVLFDWEDYGEIELGGFDLATFMFSLIRAQNAEELVSHNPSRMFGLTGADLVLETIQRIHITPRLFVKYFPFFLLCFLYLKKKLGYGLGMIQTTTAFLQSLFMEDQWKRLMLSP